jgi:hypothetical protein
MDIVEGRPSLRRFGSISRFSQAGKSLLEVESRMAECLRQVNESRPLSDTMTAIY